jgi:hypothetical protein
VGRELYIRHLQSLCDAFVTNMRKITEYFQVVDGSSTLAWRE